MRLPRNLEGVGFKAGTCSCGFSFLMCILSASMKKEMNEEKQWRKRLILMCSLYYFAKEYSK